MQAAETKQHGNIVKASVPKGEIHSGQPGRIEETELRTGLRTRRSKRSLLDGTGHGSLARQAVRTGRRTRLWRCRAELHRSELWHFLASVQYVDVPGVACGVSGTKLCTLAILAVRVASRLSD